MKLLGMVAAALLAAATAYAEDVPEPITAATTVTPALGWSDQIISNGLVMPASELGVYGLVGAVTTTTVSPPVPPLTTGATSRNTAFDLKAGAGYGATELVTVGGEYTLPIADANGAFSNAGTLAAFGGYSVVRDDKMAVVVGGDLSLGFAGGATATLHLGASVRYKLAPTLVAYTGNLYAPGPYGRQLVLGLNNSAAVALDLPVGIGWQGSPKLFAWVETSLAHVKLANTTNAWLFADMIPIDIGALYRAAKDVDVGGFFQIDVENPKDAFSLGLQARYYK